MSRNDVFEQLRLLLLIFFSLWNFIKTFLKQTMRCSQHHLFRGLFSFQREGIQTLHACHSRTKS